MNDVTLTPSQWERATELASLLVGVSSGVSDSINSPTDTSEEERVVLMAMRADAWREILQSQGLTIGVLSVLAVGMSAGMRAVDDLRGKERGTSLATFAPWVRTAVQS
jgi:hypothetical protein